MSIAIAQLRHSFGLNAKVASNIAYLDEETLVYPSGANLILYNLDQKSQQFIPGSDKSQGMTSMAVSPNRRYVAIAEKGEKATITIYDLQSLRKRRTLTSNEVLSAEYVSLAYSPDSKFLVAQGGLPDWTLLYWSLEKPKVLASTKTTSPQTNAPIYQVKFNPRDNSQICVVGNGICKIFRYNEEKLTQVGLQKMEAQNYLCQAWTSEERLLIGTDSGRVLVFEAGELKSDIGISSQKDTRDRDHLLWRMFPCNTCSDEAADAADTSGPPPITAIVAYSKGFACAGGPGMVYLFEKTDDTEFFKKARHIKIPQDHNSSDPSKAESQVIVCLTVSPSEEILVASTDTNQLYTITLTSDDLSKKDDEDQAYFEVLSQSFHSNHVTGMDVCVRKPLVATCSLDRSVRIWNSDTCDMELYKGFAEEAHSIALHPSGLYVLVGFTDKLRLMNLLIDDIRTFKEFPLRGCMECSFSNGGHRFAAVHGSVIHIYSTTTFENPLNLKGHNGKVRSVVWSADDAKIVSCGKDGAVYEWDAFTGKRVGESVLKTCRYTSVAISPDGKKTYAVGSDQTLKEVADSQILQEVDVNGTTLTSVAMSHSGRMLFSGTSTGVLRSYKYPLTDHGEYMEHQGHSSSIVKMKMTYRDQYLVTVSEDATVLVWKVQEREKCGPNRDKKVDYAEEILIPKSDLEEKNTMMAELTRRVDELKAEDKYQLRLKDIRRRETIQELSEKADEEMEVQKAKNQALKYEKDTTTTKYEENLIDAKEKHDKELEQLGHFNTIYGVDQLERQMDKLFVGEKKVLPHSQWDETTKKFVPVTRIFRRPVRYMKITVLFEEMRKENYTFTKEQMKNCGPVSLPFLCDSGADIIIIPIEFLPLINVTEANCMRCDMEISGVTGDTLQVVGAVFVKIHSAHMSSPQMAYVVKNSGTASHGYLSHNAMIELKMIDQNFPNVCIENA